MKPTCPNKKCSEHGITNTCTLIRYGTDRKKNQRYLCKDCGQTFTFIAPPVREDWQRKKPKKGHKSQHHVGEVYDEVKSSQTLCLTKTAVKGLDEKAKRLGISRSEFVEQVGRGIIPVGVNTALSTEEDFSSAGRPN